MMNRAKNFGGQECNMLYDDESQDANTHTVRVYWRSLAHKTPERASSLMLVCVCVCVSERARYLSPPAYVIV